MKSINKPLKLSFAKITLSLSTVMFLLLSCAERIDTPSDLIEANLQSTSDGKNWNEIKTMVSTYTIETSIGGNKVSSNSYSSSIKLPNFQRTELYSRGALTEITLSQPGGNYLIKFKSDEYVGTNIIPYEKVTINSVIGLKKLKDELLLKDSTYDNKPAFVLKNDNTNELFVFDKETKLLLAHISKSLYGQSTLTFSDYKRVNGYLMPFEQVVEIPESGYQTRTSYSDIIINQELSDSLFQRKKEWYVLSKGQELPEFKVKLINSNDSLSKDDLKGKVVLIDFWATWCKPCIKEFPNIEENYEKYKERGFEVVSVSIDENRKKLEDYLNKKPFNWEYSSYIEGGLDSDIARSFQILAIPKPILIDRTGKILALDVEAREENLSKLLEQLL